MENVVQFFTVNGFCVIRRRRDVVSRADVGVVTVPMLVLRKKPQLANFGWLRSSLNSDRKKQFFILQHTTCLYLFLGTTLLRSMET